MDSSKSYARITAENRDLSSDDDKAKKSYPSLGLKIAITGLRSQHDNIKYNLPFWVPGEMTM
jgi:hypothetical protein